jgi:hypothetical protein
MEWSFVGGLLLLVVAYGVAWWGVWRLFCIIDGWLVRLDPDTVHGPQFALGSLVACGASMVVGQVVSGSGGWWACAPYIRRGWPFAWGLGCMEVIVSPVYLLGDVLFWLVATGGLLLGAAGIKRRWFSDWQGRIGYHGIVVFVVVLAYLASVHLPTF